MAVPFSSRLFLLAFWKISRVFTVPSYCRMIGSSYNTVLRRGSAVVSARTGLLWMLLALGAAAPAMAQQKMTIQFAEPVQISSTAADLQFDAYGRRFALETVSNERLLAKLPVQRRSALAKYRILRGKVAGQPGSWLRLTQIDGYFEGLIWDGRELYAVTRYANVATALTTPLNVALDQTVVFRLSDAANILPAGFCAVVEPSGPNALSGLAQYKSLVSELRTNALAQATVTKQMDVALIADTEFQTQQGVNTAAEMLARLNTADGIFAEQVGLLLNASASILVPGRSDPFTSNDAGDLLNQLSAYRVAASGAARTSAIAHLITGKALTNNIVGIGARSGVCSVESGVSLSAGSSGSFYSGLILAHELGHNLGAVHDGDATGACASVGSGYIMWPTITSSTTFSQCSVDTMRPVIDAATCLTLAAVADLTVTLSTSPPGSAEVEVPLTVTATVRSSGTLAAQGAIIAFSIPATATVSALTPQSGSCSAGASPSCSLGDIPAGEQRTVQFTLTPLEATPLLLVTAAVAATNERVIANNTAFTEFAVVNNADARVRVNPTFVNARTGDPVEYTIRVDSVRTRPVRAAHLGVTPLGLRTVTYTTSVGTCTGSGACDLGDLAPGTSATVVIHGVANDVGEWTNDIRLDTQNDLEGNNNFTSVQLSISPTYNIGVSGGTLGASIAVGDNYVGEYQIRNILGTQTVTNAAVRIATDFHDPIQTVSVSGGTCVIESAQVARCQLGNLPVGDVRTLRVTVRGAVLGAGSINLQLTADKDEAFNDNSLNNYVLVKNPIDLRLQAPNWVSRVESRQVVESIDLISGSLVAATNFVATVELPATVHFTSLTLADTVCQIIDAQHGRCTAATLPHVIAREIRVGAIGDSPGTGRVKVAISADSDADTSDNAVEFDMQVDPYLDASVSTINVPEYVYVGETREFEAVVRTSYRPLPTIVFTVSYPKEIDLIRPPELTNCTVRNDLDGTTRALDCVLTDVPANAELHFHFNIRGLALQLGWTFDFRAQPTVDVQQDNNDVRYTLHVVEPSDVAVSIAAASATAAVGSRITLPRITLRGGNTGDTLGILLRVPLPGFTTVASVTSPEGWPCTITTVLECNVPLLRAGTETTFDIVLDAHQAGTFTSQIAVTAGNDSSASNNSVAVTVSATGSGSSSGGSSSGGGSGGGGRFEWLALALLGLLAARRARRWQPTAHYV